MFKAYKYRIYPTKKQAELVNKHIGSIRFVYNIALETKQIAYAGYGKNLSCFALNNQLPELKKECPWLKEINSQSLQQSITDLDSAYTKFFKGQADFPKYKSKHSQKQSFRIPQNVIVDFENEKLIVPKFKEGINIVLHRKYKGEIRQCTISRTPTGKYFVSILVENKKEFPNKFKIKENNAIGIDLGIKHFIVLSDGTKIDNPHYLKEGMKKLKFIQRKYSKHKGKRTKQKLALLHELIASQRKDFLNKLSSKIISENKTICLENLNISEMMKEHGLAQSISDVGWATFVTMLKYKAEWNGNNIIQIGRFEPSSKTCSCCGAINKNLTLNDRDWICDKCKTKHDRDHNAAINIKLFALKRELCRESTHKNQSELPTLVGVMTFEADWSLANQ